MARLLKTLASVSPSRLLLWCWLVLVVCSALTYVPPLEGVGAAGALAIFCGYPYALTLGLPDGVIRPRLKAWTLRLFRPKARLLTVIYTLRDENRIRLISARTATRKEAAYYA